MVDGRRILLWREPGPVRIGRANACRLEDAVDDATQALAVRLSVEGGRRAPAIECHAQQHMVDVRSHVLVDEAGREARQGLATLAYGDLDLGVCGTRPDQLDDTVRELERAFLSSGSIQACAVGRTFAHPLTPTRMPRKRAGTAGCPVWPICTG